MDNHTQLRHYSGVAMDAAKQVNQALMDAPEPHERRSANEILKLLQDAHLALSNAFIVYGEWTAND